MTYDLSLSYPLPSFSKPLCLHMNITTSASWYGELVPKNLAVVVRLSLSNSVWVAGDTCENITRHTFSLTTSSCNLALTLLLSRQSVPRSILPKWSRTCRMLSSPNSMRCRRMRCASSGMVQW